MSRPRNDRKEQRNAPRAPANTLPHWKGRSFADEDVRCRFLCDYVGFWLGCDQSGCKRQRRCVGDARACFERWWWMVPERIKLGFRAYIEARTAGATHEQSCKASDDEVVRQAPWIAQADAQVEARIAERNAARQSQTKPC